MLLLFISNMPYLLPEFLLSSGLILSQWETALLYNDVSHCLGTSLESALIVQRVLLFLRYNINNISFILNSQLSDLKI